jgi:hypothetical protein
MAGVSQPRIPVFPEFEDFRGFPFSRSPLGDGKKTGQRW